MDLIVHFAPSNLKNVQGKDFERLTEQDIDRLAQEYPFMSGDLLIKKADGTGVESAGTYKSVNSLLKGGHKFKIVGTKYGEPKEKPMDIKEVAEQIAKPDFVALQKEIFKPKIQNNDREVTTGVGSTRGNSGLSDRRKPTRSKKHYRRED